MFKTKLVDDNTIEVIAPDGEKFTWKTYLPIPEQHQRHYSEKLAYYYHKYFEDNIGEKNGMSIGYWVLIRMNFDEGLGIYGGKGDREDQRIFQQEQRTRIGARIRELRKEKNMEAKKLAEQASIDAANLSRIEQGRYSVGLDVLSKIALALGAKIEMTPVDCTKY